LLLPEPVKLGLFFCNFDALVIDVEDPGEGVFVPYIEDGYADVFAEVVECLLFVEYGLFLVVLALDVIELVGQLLENAEGLPGGALLLFEGLELFVHFGLLALLECLLEGVVDVFVAVVGAVPGNVGFVLVLLRL
jgi:hypothetical protein